MLYKFIIFSKSDIQEYKDMIIYDSKDGGIDIELYFKENKITYCRFKNKYIAKDVYRI